MSNKVITAISSLVENVTLDPSDVVCIDTENNVIGIGTSEPDSNYGIDINDKGILVSKKFYNKDDMQKIDFDEQITYADHSKRSFIYNFLYSLRQRIDDPRGQKRQKK